MKLQHDPLIDIDLTRHLPNLKASLSGPRKSLNIRRNTAAQEFERNATKGFIAFLVVFFAIIATICFLYA